MDTTLDRSPQPRNFGIDWERQLAELDEHRDHILAGSPSCIASIPMEEREQYLPYGELQRGKQDWMDCASRSIVEIAETKFTYLYRKDPQKYRWLLEKGYVVFRNGLAYVEFSDRYIAIKSGTTPRGNSLKSPCHAVHSWGLIPKKMLPAKEIMSWDMYHRKSDITLSMDVLAAQFRNRFPSWYALVEEDEFQTAIEQDLLQVAGYAWPKPVNGIYPRVEAEPNHAFTWFKLLVKALNKLIRDSYPEKAGDFIKELASDYRLMPYAYRIRFEEREIAVDRGVFDIVIELLTRGKTSQAMEFISKAFGSWLGGKRS